MDRRSFLTVVSAGGLAMGADPKPALMGGNPVRTAPFPSWPVIDETEERALIGVLRSGKWYRGDGKTVDRFGAPSPHSGSVWKVAGDPVNVPAEGGRNANCRVVKAVVQPNKPLGYPGG